MRGGSRDIDGLRLALARIGANQIGTHLPRDTVTRALAVPGKTSWTRFGIPTPLVSVLDGLFGCLAWAEARSVALALPDAIQRPGRDLRRVIWRLLASELESLAGFASALPTGAFYQRIGRDLVIGLLCAAERRPWMGALDVLDQLPRRPPPSGNDDAAIASQLETEVRAALTAATQALITADLAIAATVRLRGCRAVDRADTARTKRLAEERVGDLVQRTLKAVAGAGALHAALRARAADRQAIRDAVRQAAYRRQAAVLLDLVGKA